MIERSTLTSGVRVVTESVPDARSLAVGVYVGVGGRDEPDLLAGASHFLEHLLFKGTPTRSARELAEAIDATGGDMNAYTSREHTAFYARVPAAHGPMAVRILAEVLGEPALRPDEVDAEREVILEELAAAEDSPEDVVHTRLADALFPGHPLGREVLGTEATIEALSRDEIAGFHGEWYRPANLVVAAAGRTTHQEVLDLLDGFNGAGDGGAVPERSAPVADPEPLVVVRHPVEQAHLTFGWRGLAQDDPDRWALAVANYALGGGTASRLFQEVREERGLAYTVYSSVSMNVDCGALTAYAATSPAKVPEVVEITERIVAELVDGRHHRPGAHPRPRLPRGLPRAGPGGHGLPHGPHRPQRAGPRRGPHARRAPRQAPRRHPRRRRPRAAPRPRRSAHPGGRRPLRRPPRLSSPTGYGSVHGVHGQAAADGQGIVREGQGEARRRPGRPDG